MLLHEWLQYRDKRIRRLRSQIEEQEAEEERQPEKAPEVYAAQQSETAQMLETASDVEQQIHSPTEPEELVESAETEADEVAPELASAPPPSSVAEQASRAESRPEARREKKRAPRQPRSAREVLETLQPSQDLRARLEAVLARQKRLPLEEVEDEQHSRKRRRRVVETREQLVERLLDPTLTLQEAALLLGVCPTTVRRYTNRGILKCFRTPGNQRRFKLSDILEFMERREREAEEAEE